MGEDVQPALEEHVVVGDVPGKCAPGHGHGDEVVVLGGVELDDLRELVHAVVGLEQGVHGARQLELRDLQHLGLGLQHRRGVRGAVVEHLLELDKVLLQTGHRAERGKVSPKNTWT